MYLMVNPSKGVSSVFMGKWLAVVQRTARKMGHAIRQLVEPGLKRRPPLSGILELDEKYFDGKGTEKQASLLADQHQSQVRSALIASDQAAELRPLVERFIDQKAHLKTDQNWVYQQIGKGFARGDVHNNTAESFNSLLERARHI